MQGYQKSLKMTELSSIWIEHCVRRVRKAVSSSERSMFELMAVYVLVNVLRKM